MKYRLQMSGEGTQHPGFDGNLAGTVGVADDGKTFTVEAPNVIAAAPSPPPEGVVPGATGMSARDMALAADRSAPADPAGFRRARGNAVDQGFPTVPTQTVAGTPDAEGTRPAGRPRAPAAAGACGKFSSASTSPTSRSWSRGGTRRGAD